MEPLHGAETTEIFPVRRHTSELYGRGEGVKQNFSEAVRWYRKAAEQNLPQAQYNLGLSYYNGDGITKNLSEALKWWRMAANQGDYDSQRVLTEIGETW